MLELEKSTMNQTVIIIDNTKFPVNGSFYPSPLKISSSSYYYLGLSSDYFYWFRFCNIFQFKLFHNK